MVKKLICKNKDVIYNGTKGVIESYTWEGVKISTVNNTKVICPLDSFLTGDLKYVDNKIQNRINKAIANGRVAVPTSSAISPFNPHQSSIFDILMTKELISGYAYGNRTEVDLTMAYIRKIDLKAGRLCFSGHINDFPKKGYTLWELLASNLNGAAKIGWTNIIDNPYIKELPHGKKDPIGKEVYRLVFARNKKGEHVFLGVYRFKEYDPSEPKIAIYERIASNYKF